MTVGTILLSSDGNYLTREGNLPQRPAWDKEWLKTMVSLNTISHAGYDTLPPSIRDISTVTNGDPTMAITIPELGHLPDLLYVVRSSQPAPGGRKFRLDEYESVLKEQRFEVYRRKLI